MRNASASVRRRSFAASILVVACAVLMASPSRAEEASPGVVVETIDGTRIVGTLRAELELILVQPDGAMKIAAARVRRLSVSSVSEREAGEIEATVKSIAERWQRDEWEVREAAMKEALTLPPVAAPYLARLRSHSDAEVADRAKTALDALQAGSQLLEPRDWVLADGPVLRGRLAPQTLELKTVLGPFEIALGVIRTLRRLDVPDRVPPAEKEDEWPPPIATVPDLKPVNGAIPVVVFLRGGWRLVGIVSADGLRLVDEEGTRLSTEKLLGIDREGAAPGSFRVSRDGMAPVRARIDAKEIEIKCGARKWEFPSEMVEEIVVGPLLRAGGIERLVASVLQAKAAGEKLPDQRFWVHIIGQLANPWDSKGRKGVTWSLLDVKGEACLVGADNKTNAYEGDTDIGVELPILALRPANLAPPVGLDVSSPYLGWARGECRLTRPIRGSALKSIEDANSFIEAEFGKGWRMGEHHDATSTGWHWWAYWVEQGAEKK